MPDKNSEDKKPHIRLYFSLCIFCNKNITYCYNLSCGNTQIFQDQATVTVSKPAHNPCSYIAYIKAKCQVIYKGRQLN